MIGRQPIQSAVITSRRRTVTKCGLIEAAARQIMTTLCNGRTARLNCKLALQQAEQHALLFEAAALQYEATLNPQS
jgi:hypothetical protein